MRPLAIAAFTATLVACTPTLRPAQPEVRTPGAVRVTLDSLEGKTFVFLVWNETSLPIVVDRDAVRMITPHDTRDWNPGRFMRRFVEVPAGGVHDVKMNFDLGGLSKGEQVAFEFSGAVVAGGQRIPVPPFKFRVE